VRRDEEEKEEYEKQTQYDEEEVVSSRMALRARYASSTPVSLRFNLRPRTIPDRLPCHFLASVPNRVVLGGLAQVFRPP
jgi:hypothetical protein